MCLLDPQRPGPRQAGTAGRTDEGIRVKSFIDRMDHARRLASGLQCDLGRVNIRSAKIASYPVTCEVIAEVRRDGCVPPQESKDRRDIPSRPAGSVSDFALKSEDVESYVPCRQYRPLRGIAHRYGAPASHRSVRCPPSRRAARSAPARNPYRLGLTCITCKPSSSATSRTPIDSNLEEWLERTSFAAPRGRNTDWYLLCSTVTTR